MGGIIFEQEKMPFYRLPHMRAVGFMLVSTAAFSGMNVLVRLASETMSAPLIVTLRNLLTLLLLLPFVAPNRFAMVHTARLRDHFLRSLVGAVGMTTWTYCLTLMPLDHATALSFTAPLLATIFAIFVLKEHATTRHFIGLAFGFAGTLIILRPNAAGFSWDSLLVIFAATAWATTSMFVKSLSRTEPALRMVFYMNFFMFLVALPFGFSHWRMPNSSEWLILLGIALCSVAMHFTMVKAYALAPVVTLMPFDFMRLVYTTILAYFIFGERSDPITWVGAAIIVASVVLIARRDRKVTATS